MLNFDFLFNTEKVAWDYVPHTDGRSLKEYAEEGFNRHSRFYVVIPMNTPHPQNPVPLSCYSIKREDRSPAAISYLFSTKSLHGPFKFHIALPYGRHHRTNLHVVKRVDQDRWIHPKRIIHFLHYAPRNSEWQKRIAQYCFRKYGPELMEWDELITKIQHFLALYPNDGSSKAISVFRALKQVDRLKAFNECNVTDTVEGASIYCYYSLRSDWKHDHEIEWKLKQKYRDGYRNLTQIYCLAALNVVDDFSKTKHYMRSYKHYANHGLDTEHILQPIHQQFRMARVCQLTPPSATAISRARSLLDLSELLTLNNRPLDAQRMRQKARELTRTYLRENPDDPDALLLTGELLKNSSLSQDKLLSEHYYKRANSIRSAHSSPREAVAAGELSRRTF